MDIVIETETFLFQCDNLIGRLKQEFYNKNNAIHDIKQFLNKSIRNKLSILLTLMPSSLQS